MKRQYVKYYLAGAVALLTFAVYLPALQNDFVEWDDSVYVFENPHIRSFSPAFFRWAFFDFYAANWHPLTWISHALDYAVWGLNPLGHHLTNNVLHAVNTFLVVLLVVRLMEACGNHPSPPPSPPRGEGSSISPPLRGGDRGEGEKKIRHFTPHDSRFMLIAAATTGLLFGLHPLHVESVAWVSERKDLLCALFFLLSIMSYRTYRTYRTYKTYFLSLAFFVFALLSKPMAVSLPFVLLILDWYPFKRITSLKTFRTSFIEKLPFFALSIGSSVLTVLAQKAGGTMELMDSVPLPARLLVAVKALIAYLWKMLVPVNLVPYCPHPYDASLLSPAYLAALLLVIGITAAGVLIAGKQRAWMTVWGYYVITLIPVLGLVQVGGQAMADRYTYLPGIGPFLTAGLLIAWTMGRIDRYGMYFLRLSSIAGVTVILCLSFLTVRQISIWKDSITLWSYVIEKEPVRSYFAYNNRGLAFSRAGEFDRAIEDFQRAIELKPGYADTYSNLGIALFKKGRPDRASEQYRIAIRLKPGLVEAHRNLAIALYTSGRIAEALEHYLSVTRLRSDDAGAHADLGAAYGAMGEYYKAIEHFHTALRLRPDFADAHYNLAVAYGALGRMDKAGEHYQEALRLKPQSPGR